MTNPKRLSRESTHGNVMSSHRFRKKDGVWQRNEMGTKEWRTLVVTTMPLITDADKNGRGRRRTNEKEWSWV